MSTLGRRLGNAKEVIGYIFEHEEKDFEDNRDEWHVYAVAQRAENELNAACELAEEAEVLMALVGLYEPTEGTKQAMARVRVAILKMRGV